MSDYFDPKPAFPVPISPIPRSFILIVPDSDVPLPLGVDVPVKSLKLIADQGVDGLTNADPIFIQIRDTTGEWVDAFSIDPGDSYNWIAPERSIFYLSSFRVRVVTGDDGIRIIHDF